MTPRAWVSFSVCAFILGGLLGWGVRTSHTGDRYIRSLAERHEAAARYYNQKTDQLISDNERTYANGKKKN